MRDRRSFTDGQKKCIMWTGLVLFLALSGLIAWFAGRPLIRFVGQPELFRAWVNEQGPWAPVLFVGMVALQVIVAIIPGEPLEIAAGYAFGAVEGTILCMIGILIGSLVVFLAVRKLGQRLAEVFFPVEKLRSLKFLQNERKLTFWVFLIYFIPGTPKDLLCYFVGLTNLPLANWIFISLVARIPSIVTSTIGGDALGEERYVLAAVVFAVTVAISGAGLLCYQAICRAKGKKKS